ncbi:hypothetical protein H4R20_003577 [Coemansia guatemalensis]|uniref:Protein kinase domain-containing protein n=1 Tax=Coemansia guatemalensis TaxID=2761395 RepID=A0A9W8HZB1_9FUNG|nr:hypothetical protein H4R20_003577 [Coemansia guatemalensis]
MYKVSNPEIKYTVAAQVGENTHGVMVVGDYVIEKQIGHGSFGTVYEVKSTITGTKFAMKEYNKSGLRRRQQSNLMRSSGGTGLMPRGRGARGGMFNARRAMLQEQQQGEASDPFYLIKRELAVSKKLKHPNLVRVHEVLNDDEQDVLYLAIDLCENGPVQKVDPTTSSSTQLSPAQAHKYFVESLLGLEYLHENNIIHRDIKPDNLLLTRDNTLKIADFGESTMVARHEDKVTGSTGSPAFMAPELCQGIGEVSGEAADIWSLGVCLYSFIYSTLPFKGHSTIEVLDSISQGELKFPGPYDEQLQDLLSRMLDRSPDSRIRIEDIREHPWVTQNGSYALPTKEENCEHIVEPVTQEDVNNTVKHIYDIMPVIMAIAKLRRFRRRVREKREREQRERRQREREQQQMQVDTEQPDHI